MPSLISKTAAKEENNEEEGIQHGENHNHNNSIRRNGVIYIDVDMKGGVVPHFHYPVLL